MRRQRGGDQSLDVELADLPLAARWREWMLRVEAAIFASQKPVAREALVRLVGEACRFDDLIADLIYGYRHVNEFGVDDWVSAGHVDSP